MSNRILRRPALLPQMRTDVKNSQRRIGLHDLNLLWIFVEEISVGEKDIHGRIQLASTFNSSSKLVAYTGACKWTTFSPGKLWSTVGRGFRSSSRVASRASTSRQDTRWRLFLLSVNPMSSRDPLARAMHREGAIKLVRVRALKHHGHVFAIRPIRLFPQLRPYALVKLGSGQRIRNGNSNVIGTRVTDQLDRVLNVLPVLARIAKLQEEAGPNPFVPQFSRAMEIWSTRVPLSMASRIFCDPD